MLQDLIFALLEADGDPKLKERAYRNLERIGVDRRSADAIASEFRKEKGQNALPQA